MKAGGRPGVVKNVAPEGSPWTMPRQPELDKWMLWFGLVSGVDWLNDSQLSERSEILGRSSWHRGPPTEASERSEARA